MSQKWTVEGFRGERIEVSSAAEKRKVQKWIDMYPYHRAQGVTHEALMARLKKLVKLT